MQSKQSCLRERDARPGHLGRLGAAVRCAESHSWASVGRWAVGPSGWARLASALLVTSIQAGLSVIK